MLCWRDSLNDDQPPTATWTRQCQDTGLVSFTEAVVTSVILVWHLDPEQVPDPGDIGGPVAVSEEAVVTDAVLALWQNVDEEPADELSHCQCHGRVSARAFDTVILDAEGDALVVHSDQSAVGDGNPVRVARQICQYGFRSGEGFLGVDHPVDFAQRFDEGVEGIPVQQVSMIAVELQFPRIVQSDHPFQNKTTVQPGQNPDGQEKVFPAGDPFGTVRRQAAARNDHVDMRMMRHR